MLSRDELIPNIKCNVSVYLDIINQKYTLLMEFGRILDILHIHVFGYFVGIITLENQC